LTVELGYGATEHSVEDDEIIGVGGGGPDTSEQYTAKHQ